MVINYQVVYFIALIIINAQYSFHPSPVVSGDAVFIASLLCCSMTVAFCIIMLGSGNLFQHYFLVIGNIFAGSGSEIYTGLLTRYLRRQESVNDIQI